MQVTTLTDNKQNDRYKYMHPFNTIDSTGNILKVGVINQAEYL